MHVVMIGYLGADAKTTEKGFSFSLGQKNREGNEEKTLWVSCFQNYTSGVFDFLKKGTLVQVIGELNISIYNHPDKGAIPNVMCRVIHIELLPNRNKDPQ